jgi:predicted acetyltransferase
MNAAAPLPHGVEVLPAAAAQEPVLANLLELYAHDFSELAGPRLGEDGRFGYPELPLYWRDEGRFPFLVWVDGRLAGFALVRKGSRISGDPGVWDVAEFFVARGYRKRGVGAAAAHEIWRRFPGTWEVRVMERNTAARAFWRAAISAFTSSGAEPRITATGEKTWHVFSFVSPAVGR